MRRAILFLIAWACYASVHAQNFDSTWVGLAGDTTDRASLSAAETGAEQGGQSVTAVTS